MSDFVTAGRAGEVGQGEVGSFQVRERAIAIANVGGTLHAFDDICTHKQCSLSEGDLDGTTIECPCHGSQFDVRTGEVVNGPATEPVGTFDVREEGEDLQVALD